MKVSADSIVAQICGSLVLYESIGWLSPALLLLGIGLQIRRAHTNR